MSPQRNTIQRQLVLEAVRALHIHPTAEQVYSQVAQKHPAVSRGTVYRNLTLLAAQGDIQRVTHLNAADRFDFDTRPHYHFYCRGCGQVYDVDMPYMEDLLTRPNRQNGFMFEGCQVVFTGLCPACSNNPQGGEDPALVE